MDRPGHFGRGDLFCARGLRRRKRLAYHGGHATDWPHPWSNPSRPTSATSSANSAKPPATPSPNSHAATTSTPPHSAGSNDGFITASPPTTAAALMIAEGAQPLTVTMDVYGHLFPDQDAALAAALDARLRESLERRKGTTVPTVTEIRRIEQNG